MDALGKEWSGPSRAEDPPLAGDASGRSIPGGVNRTCCARGRRAEGIGGAVRHVHKGIAPGGGFLTRIFSFFRVSPCLCGEKLHFRIDGGPTGERVLKPQPRVSVRYRFFPFHAVLPPGADIVLQNREILSLERDEF